MLINQHSEPKDPGLVKTPPLSDLCQILGGVLTQGGVLKGNSPDVHRGHVARDAETDQNPQCQVVVSMMRMHFLSRAPATRSLISTPGPTAQVACSQWPREIIGFKKHWQRFDVLLPGLQRQVRHHRLLHLTAGRASSKNKERINCCKQISEGSITRGGH